MPCSILVFCVRDTIVSEDSIVLSIQSDSVVVLLPLYTTLLFSLFRQD